MMDTSAMGVLNPGNVATLPLINATQALSHNPCHTGVTLQLSSTNPRTLCSDPSLDQSMPQNTTLAHKAKNTMSNQSV